MDPATRRSMISEAVSKVLAADIGAFCNISEKKTGKIMIVVENFGEEGKAVISVQGDLTDEQVAKVKEIIENLGGDTLQLLVEVPQEKIPEVVDNIFSELLGADDFDIDIELAIE